MGPITPCLWFAGNAGDAVAFYVALIPNSRVTRVHRAAVDTPGNKAGDVLLVEFELNGAPFQALNGGPHDRFNDAISLSISCEDQAEVDRLWDGLLADGGRAVACGWLKDRHGLSWQIVPRRLIELMSSPDREAAGRVMRAMMMMVKLDVAALERAAKP